jgi:hypothetical protein
MAACHWCITFAEAAVVWMNILADVVCAHGGALCATPAAVAAESHLAGGLPDWLRLLACWSASKACRFAQLSVDIAESVILPACLLVTCVKQVLACLHLMVSSCCNDSSVTVHAVPQS